MKVLIAFNPVAGKGRGAPTARALQRHLEDGSPDSNEPLKVSLIETQLGAGAAWLTEPLRKTDLLVIIGGDGAVRMVAPEAIKASIPIYHYPSGTENLFSRDHGMTADPERLLQAIRRWEILETDVAEVEGAFMMLCASMGFDAEVVHDLARHRSGPISHFSYVAPILRTLFSQRWWRLRGEFSISLDGGAFTHPRHGLLVIANSRQYALRMDPARTANLTDRHLDVVLLPSKSAFGLLIWALRCRLGRHMHHPAVFLGRAERLKIRSEPGEKLQVDGEPVVPGSNFTEIEAHILEERLLVLKPPSEKSFISENRS